MKHLLAMSGPYIGGGVFHGPGTEEQGDQEEVEETCSLCDCLEHVQVKHELPSGGCRYHQLRKGSLDKNKLKILRTYFHEACHQCPEISEESLCAECKHMRLGHLVRCILLADSPAEKYGLKGSISFSMTPAHIDLRLGRVQDLEDRSLYCDTCRMLFGAAKEVMEQTGLLPDATCRLTLERESLFYGETVGGIKCDFTIKLYVGDSPENWTLSEQSMGAFSPFRPVYGAFIIGRGVITI